MKSTNFKMKLMFVLISAFALSGCGGSNSDGSSKSTYNSCKIISSQATFAADKDNDLKQCWNAPGNGYESKGDAMQWCERQINAYMSSRYVIGHTVSYMVESTYCK
ncbi:hypothetical protein GCM10009124_33370 [Shewanella xiamenensis]|uniref:hypothetical protein n=1 Tax=Shewanella xiamenensis TaxID=332186 RepID=UPI0019AB3FCC|nr:hypothetical protein [Shewanella xiamenensis]GGN01112.1 hypothetical protein GCM10009124_33370 [Shewanella xiamenensis]